MSERKKPSIPLAGELWKNKQDKQSDYPFFITKVGSNCISSVNADDGTKPPDKYPPWIWWDNLVYKMTGNASLNWFISNCEKIS